MIVKRRERYHFSQPLHFNQTQLKFKFSGEEMFRHSQSIQQGVDHRMVSD